MHVSSIDEKSFELGEFTQKLQLECKI